MNGMLLAEMTVSTLEEKWKSLFTTPGSQLLFTLGCLLAVIIVTLFTVIIYSQRDKPLRHRHRRSSSATPEPVEAGAEPSEKGRRRRKRKSDRPRRPSGVPLAQTGGLPPKRDPDTPPHMP
jgi:hypothetical protein